jgi:hypothetical protein
MSRNRAFLTGLLAAATMFGGCAFKKATPGEITGSGGTPGDSDGGDEDVKGGAGSDINLPPPVDAMQFEAEASQNCIEANPQTMNLPPDVLILLDRSGSMAQAVDGSTCAVSGAGGRGGRPPAMGDCGPTSKWTLMTTALVDFVQTVNTPVNWGLMFFGSGNTTNCDISMTANVPPGPATASMIASAIAGTGPATSTPTTAAETAAAAYLSKLNDGNPKFILLATDGIPTCGKAACVQGGTAQCDDANAIAAVQTAHDTMMIPTFVLGIGSDLGGGEATLTSMATVGGFPRANATPAYYPVSSAADLQAAFATISGMVGGCFFSVKPVPSSATDITAVLGDGNPIPQDGTDGWTFVTMGGASGVQLNGKSCDDYKNKVIKDVIVQLPCIIP